MIEGESGLLSSKPLGSEAIADMSTSRGDLETLYCRRARYYDFAVATYRLIGLREKRYRHDTVEALSLRSGDKVVDLGCGTGLNFEFLQRAIGNRGSILAVDIADAMLEVARKRIMAQGWSNIELINADMTDYVFPSCIAGVVCTFAISLVPEFDDVIRKAAAALQPGGRLAVLDIKAPEHWPEWMAWFTAWLNRPFGVSLESTKRRPWESINRYLKEVLFQEYYFSYLYLSVGEAQ